MFLFSKPKPKTFFQKFKDKWLALTLILSVLPTLYASYEFMIKPDYDAFKQNTKIVAALYPSGALQLAFQINRIPNIPVTVVVTDGQHELFHRHYAEGIPELFGKEFEVGIGTMQEVHQLSFSPSNGHLQIKFIFNSWQTLLIDNYTIWKVPLQLIESSTKEDSHVENKFIDNNAPGFWV